MEGTLKPGEQHKISSVALGITVPYNGDLQLHSRWFLKTGDTSCLNYAKTTIIQINVKITKFEVAEN